MKYLFGSTKHTIKGHMIYWLHNPNEFLSYFRSQKKFSPANLQWMETYKWEMHKILKEPK